jgi:hypothetical protein|tara:strand:+ start:1267 stop:1611 length:345 start_codon:yes stop_codon:yes gene_type:complete
MRVENMTNRDVTKAFFKATRDIIAENTSPHYSTLAMNGIRTQLCKEFKFLKSIHIKGKSVEVDNSINSVGGRELKRFFIKVVNLMGPNYLKMLLAQRLGQKELFYLETLGLKFG